MKTLIIAEKPDMGRQLAKVIDAKAVNKRTHFEGNTHLVTWAIGHLIELAEPDVYAQKYKKWDLHTLPIIPDEFILRPNPRTIQQLHVIESLAKQCDHIVNACDAGREGQLIFSLIQRYLNLRQPVQRLWISDLTTETIARGFASMKSSEAYDHLTQAARSRSEADWLIGMNGTRAFTTKYHVLLSVGRVQTPVLALIYDRQVQIEQFRSHTFYELEAIFTQGDMTYRGLWQGERMSDHARAQALMHKVKSQTGRIQSYEDKETKEYPPKLYDLTLLQREANAKFGFSAKKTLDLAQGLYEKHKLISYPRTNSNYVTEANIAEMHRTVETLVGSPYDEFARKADHRLVHIKNAYICQPKKVEDHHAILPTKYKAVQLAPDEQRIYDIIVRRFLSQFYAPATYRVHTVLTEVKQEIFKTIVKEQLSLGWKVIDVTLSNELTKDRKNHESTKDNEEILVQEPFALLPAVDVTCMDATVKEKETQAPKLYTEGTLLRAMESAGKQIEDEELRDLIKDSGLGTPATRASIIERLKHVGYIDMQGKQIIISIKGRKAIEWIREAGIELLTSPEMTGQWEKRLNAIARGEATDSAFMENVKKFATMIVEKVKAQAHVQPIAMESKKHSPARPSAASRSVAQNKSPATKQRNKKVVETGQVLRTMLATCPREGCGGQLFKGRKGYGCTNYQTGCSFVIWLQSYGRELTDVQVKALVEKGQTAKLKLVTTEGQSVTARIVLTNPNDGALSIQI